MTYIMASYFCLAMWPYMRQCRRMTLPRKPTCKQVARAIAAVGGHIKSNGEPGWIVIGRGMERLLDFSLGWRARAYAPINPVSSVPQ
ncbi:MAG: hypothetical protein ACI8RZ_006269 [Myxococcota bacterium]|jgi:hypothetical protein